MDGAMSDEERERDQPTTELLEAARAGDADAVDRLFTLAYDELRQVARQVRHRGAGETLDTTALLHEAYFKLSSGRPVPASDRAHFLSIVARAMRQVLVDAARRRVAEKRGGGAFAVTVTDAGVEAHLQPEEYLALEQALEELEAVEPRRARVVECRFIAGLSVEETAHALGVSTPTVKRDWQVARAWLADALRE
jgi:RNA polymerase sigma factor (TIGR02999 family)